MVYKHKTYVLIVSYLLGCFILFSYGFSWTDSNNSAAATALATKQRQFNDLQNEQRSFQLGSQDLVALKSKPYQPDDFFSRDVRVVSEIKKLEALGKDAGLDFELAVSGTVSSGTKIPNVAGEILSIPYTINLIGQFSSVVAFLARMEQLDFITHVKNISVAKGEGGEVHAVLNATFYIKK